MTVSLEHKSLNIHFSAIAHFEIHCQNKGLFELYV